jgi:L-threonylcarbamoyladenylate synthase
MAEDFVELSETAKNIYKNLLPGPFTIVSKGKQKMAPGIEAENGTLGIRIPDNKYIYDLVEKLGKPITATSANLSGRTPNYSIESFLRPLSKKKKEMIDLIVNGGKLPKNKPSTVIDATEPELKILRRGDLITGSSQTLISKSEIETEKIAEFLLKKSLERTNGKPLVFLLSGDLGCGKTVFSRKIGNLLGVKEKITSPTFVIYNEYKIAESSSDLKVKSINKFLHFDLYRITADYELKEINFFDLFADNTISCIEWPENMGQKNLKKLEKQTKIKKINFEYMDSETRQIEYQL